MISQDQPSQQQSTHISRRSVIETRKKIGHYLFQDKEPLFKTSASKLYLAINQRNQ